MIEIFLSLVCLCLFYTVMYHRRYIKDLAQTNEELKDIVEKSISSQAITSVKLIESKGENRKILKRSNAAEVMSHIYDGEDYYR